MAQFLPVPANGISVFCTFNSQEPEVPELNRSLKCLLSRKTVKVTGKNCDKFIYFIVRVSTSAVNYGLVG
jgi:hypothetical protein